MRLLGIDLGDRRTGLALGDAETGIVSPAGMIELPRGPRLLEALATAVEREAPDAIVLGLPLNMDGSEGDAAAAARAFGAALAERTRRTVHYQDERLSTFAADQAMARTGRTRGAKKALRDALAAVEILRDFLRREESGDQGDAERR